MSQIFPETWFEVVLCCEHRSFLFRTEFRRALDISQQKMHGLPFTWRNNIKLRRLFCGIDDRRIMVRFPSWENTLFLPQAYRAQPPIQVVSEIPFPLVVPIKILYLFHFSPIYAIFFDHIILLFFDLTKFGVGGLREKFLKLHCMHLCPWSG